MKKVLAIIVAGLLVLGAGYLLYMRFVGSGFNLEQMIQAMSEMETIQVDYKGTVGEKEVVGDFVLRPSDQVREVFDQQVIVPYAIEITEDQFDFQSFRAQKVRQPIIMIGNHLVQAYQINDDVWTAQLWIELKTRRQ